MAARDEDFLGEGTADPFTGLAPAEDPSTADQAARAKVNRWNIATSTQRGDYEREAKQRQLNAEFYDNPDSVIDESQPAIQIIPQPPPPGGAAH